MPMRGIERIVFFGVNAAVGAVIGKLFGPAAGVVVGLGASWLALDQQERRAQAEAAGAVYEAPPWAAPVSLVVLPGSLAVAGVRRAREVWDAAPGASGALQDPHGSPVSPVSLESLEEGWIQRLRVPNINIPNA